MDTKPKSSHSSLPYLCGGALLLAIIALTVFKVSPANLIFYGLLLTCPLMHITMLKDHKKDNHD